MNAVMNTCVTSVNHIGRDFCAFASGMSIQSTVLIAILFIVDWLLRKRVKATFRYWIWMLVFIKLILPPSLSSPTSISYWCHDWVAKHHPTPLSVVAVPVENPVPPEIESVGWASAHAESSAPMPVERATVPVQSVPESPTPSPRASLTRQGTLFLLWLVGVLVLSTLLIQRVCFVRGLIAQSHPAEAPLLDLLDECRNQTNVRRPIGLRLSPSTFSPAVCGLLRPVILLPAALLQRLSNDDLRAVLIHELAHLKRGDLWLNSVQTLLQIAYFYNPFVWLANMVTRRVREQAVDEMVLVALGAEAKSYSRTLVDIAEMAFFKANWTLRLIGVAESKKSLEGRIKHMLTRPIPKSAKLGLSGILSLLIIATLLLPMAKGAARRNLQTRPAPVKDTEILVVRWMAVMESNLDKDIRSIAKPVETPSKSYQCLICDANDLIDVIRKGVQAHQVIDIDRNLRWIRPSPEHLMSDGYSHSDNLKHPLYAGYSCSAAGPYKLDASGPAAKLDLRYESVSCALNPGPHVEGTIHFVGEVMPGKAVASLGNLKQGDQVKASHLFVWQAIEVPAKLVPYLQAYHSVPDWIQEGPSGILSMARNGLDRNSLLLSPTRASEKWTHTFPDGTQARLVAVFSPRTDPFRFWNPEGQPISGIPEWNDSDMAAKSLAAIIERPEYKLVDPKAHETAASDGKYYTNYGWNEVTADRPPVFNFPHGYGTWQTVGQLRQGQPLEHDGLTYTIEEVSSQGDGKSLAVTHVKMWYGRDPNAGIRLVAVHKNGKEFPMEASEGVIGGSLERGFRSMYYQGTLGLLEKDVDHFNLQKRPLAWARFAGFALGPEDALAAISSSRAPASEPNVAGGVWITFLPRSPIRSVAEYHQALMTTDVQAPERTTSVSFPACDLEIRRAADQERVTRVALAESKFLPYNLTEQQIRRIGPLPNGDYLVAFSRNGRRYSNVARLRLDSTYDPAKEPTLSLVPLPLEAWQDLPLLGIRAVGPTPIDPLLTNDMIPFPKLVVDGEERKLTTMKWVGPVGPIPPGQQEVRILDLGHYQPAIELGRTHTAKAILGKYESAEVRIPADDVLGRQWDAAAQKPTPYPEPNAALRGGVGGEYSILLLDDKDPACKDKDTYDDRLYLMDSRGNIEGAVTGFNVAGSMGGSHVLVVDDRRRTLWVTEDAGGTLWHFDLATGKLLGKTPDLKASAAAVDPITGDVWVVIPEAPIEKSRVVVVSPAGKSVAEYAIQGFDVAYSRYDDSFWVVGKDVTKVDKKGKVIGQIAGQIPSWACSVSIDQKTGNAWVAVKSLSE